jgi:FkbM family methyltransferase
LISFLDFVIDELTGAANVETVYTALTIKQLRMKNWWQSMSDGWKPLQSARARADGKEFEGSSKHASANATRSRAQDFLIKLARASFLRRGLFRPFVSRLVFWVRLNRPIDVIFRGAIFRLEGNPNLIEHGVMLHPNYNKADIDFLEQGLSAGSVFIDIGSNIGLYALPLAKIVGPKGRVIAIDANPQMAQTLTRNAALNGLDNMSILSVAVSDVPGNANLSVRKNDHAIVKISEDVNGSIKVTTLMDIVTAAGLEKIDGLKIDIEGHEDKALAPFILAAPEALLPKRIVIEWGGAIGEYPACLAAFNRRGYSLKGRSRNNSFYALQNAV